MTPDKLKQIDECLIQLLRDRMALLADSEPISLEQQLSSVAPLLAQFGVPESIWANVVMSCFVALNSESSPTGNNVARKITIIGGRGRMGKFFTDELSAAGHDVSVLGQQDWDRADQLLGQADLVLVSVPIHHTVDVIKRAAKYLSPTTALADITSIKAQPVQAMLEHHAGPVMGLHPMFGPSVKSFSEQKIVVCSGRNDDVFQWLLDFMQSKGGDLITCTPEEHDQIMVIVQATRHFCRFSLGVFLATEGIDIERSLSMSSPTYRQELDIVKRLFAQSPHLFVEIMFATKERCQAIERLANTYSSLAQLVTNQDRAALIQKFETTKRFLEKETVPLVQESNKQTDYILNSASLPA